MSEWSEARKRLLTYAMLGASINTQPADSDSDGDVLRRAARLMNQRAEAVLLVDREHPQDTGGVDAWYAPAFIEDAFRAHSPLTPPYPEGCERSWEAVGDYLAAIPPQVMVAVARWLVDESHAPETDLGDGVSTGGPRMEALAVARAYLAAEAAA